MPLEEPEDGGTHEIEMQTRITPHSQSNKSQRNQHNQHKEVAAEVAEDEGGEA
jgi:hypothetical protein